MKKITTVFLLFAISTTLMAESTGKDENKI
jgi:hypothetical protein